MTRVALVGVAVANDAGQPAVSAITAKERSVADLENADQPKLGTGPPNWLQRTLHVVATTLATITRAIPV